MSASSHLPKFIFPILIALFGTYLKNSHNQIETNILFNGTYDERFGRVADTFKQNLRENWERDGGAFVLYYKGEKVIDIWGGYMDRESLRPWTEDTMNVAFSSTKAMGAICIAKLVDQGHISYDDLVTKIWPEFGKNGKENVTIQWILSHMGGLAWTDLPISLETALNQREIEKVFEDQIPQWPPGQSMGYHAITYGWLVDAIVRKADPKKRTIGQFWREEINKNEAHDFHMGLQKSESHRVSRLRKPSLYNFLDEYFTKPSDFRIWRLLHQWWTNGPLIKVSKNVPWIDLVNTPLNNIDLFPIEQCAVLGIGTARGMAEIFEELRSGKIVNEKTMKLLTTPFHKQEDIVTGANVTRGQGMMFHEFKYKQNVHTLFGHAGYGGQNVRIDFDKQITFAYMSNGLKVGFGDTARTYIRLLQTVYDILEELQ